MGTRPDCLEVASSTCWPATPGTGWYGWNWGCRSAHSETLAHLNRGHDVACFTEAAARAAGRGLAVVAHVILGAARGGAPGDAGHRRLSGRTAVQGVGTRLCCVCGRETGAGPAPPGRGVVCLSEEQYVDGVVDFIERLPPDLVIHRLTSDPHAAELVAPAWCLDKPRVLKSPSERNLPGGGAARGAGGRAGPGAGTLLKGSSQLAENELPARAASLWGPGPTGLTGGARRFFLGPQRFSPGDVGVPGLY